MACDIIRLVGRHEVAVYQRILGRLCERDLVPASAFAETGFTLALYPDPRVFGVNQHLQGTVHHQPP